MRDMILESVHVPRRADEEYIISDNRPSLE